MSPTLRNVLEEVHRLEEDVRVRVHLAGVSARTDWRELEAELERFAGAAESQPDLAANALVQRGMDLQERLRRLRTRIFREVDGVVPATPRSRGSLA